MNINIKFRKKFVTYGNGDRNLNFQPTVIIRLEFTNCSLDEYWSWVEKNTMSFRGYTKTVDLSDNHWVVCLSKGKSSLNWDWN